jgi:hypothetical protein
MWSGLAEFEADCGSSCLGREKDLTTVGARRFVVNFRRRNRKPDPEGTCACFKIPWPCACACPFPTMCVPVVLMVLIGRTAALCLFCRKWDWDALALEAGPAPAPSAIDAIFLPSPTYRCARLWSNQIPVGRKLQMIIQLSISYPANKSPTKLKGRIGGWQRCRNEMHLNMDRVPVPNTHSHRPVLPLAALSK